MISGESKRDLPKEKEASESQLTSLSQRIVNWLKKSVTSDRSTAYQLNYLTLNIKEPSIQKELLNHTIEQKLQISKFIILLAVLNLAWALYNYFFAHDFYILVSAIIYFIGLVPLFLLLRWRWRSGLRFLPPFIFIVLSVYYVTAAYSNN